MILAPNFDPDVVENGFQAHISGVSRELAKVRGVDLAVVSSGDRRREEVIDGYQFEMMPKGLTLGRIPLEQISGVMRAIRKNAPDVLHLQGSAFEALFLCAAMPQLRRIPRVVTIHGHPVEEGIVNGMFRQGGVLHVLFRLAERFLMVRFDCVVCVTERRRNELLEKYGGGRSVKMSVIPNGIEQELLETVEGDETCRCCESDSRTLRIFCAKSLVPYNGQEYLLRAFRMIVDVVPDARLTLAGDGWQRPQLESIASELGLSSNVDFLGWIPNPRLRALLRRATVSVTCSVPLCGVEEGSSISILEAMALGVPVIATCVGGSREIIRDGVTGMLVPPADSIAIRDAILSLWNNPTCAYEIASAGRGYIEGSRTWKTVSESYCRIYSSLAKCR